MRVRHRVRTLPPTCFKNVADLRLFASYCRCGTATIWPVFDTKSTPCTAHMADCNAACNDAGVSTAGGGVLVVVLRVLRTPLSLVALVATTTGVLHLVGSELLDVNKYEHESTWKTLSSREQCASIGTSLASSSSCGLSACQLERT
jgi:hypothetical protein